MHRFCPSLFECAWSFHFTVISSNASICIKYCIFLSSRFSLSSWKEKEMKHPDDQERETKTKLQRQCQWWMQYTFQWIRFASFRYDSKWTKSNKRIQRNEALSYALVFFETMFQLLFPFIFHFGVCVFICVHRSDLSFVRSLVRRSVCSIVPISNALNYHRSALYCKCTNVVWIWWLPFIQNSFCYYRIHFHREILHWTCAYANNKKSSGSSDRCEYVSVID